jgi:hypothetical protein
MNAQQHLNMLGLEVQDKVTLFNGIVTSVSFDLYGCLQYAVSPRVDKDGKIPEGRWIDAHRVTIINHTPVMVLPAFVEVPGKSIAQTGPADKPTR